MIIRPNPYNMQAFFYLIVFLYLISLIIRLIVHKIALDFSFLQVYISGRADRLST